MKINLENNLKNDLEKKSEDNLENNLENKISKKELKTAFLLAGIYSSRMLGLFLIFPAFSTLATSLTNSTTFKIGLALGIYSLAQAILQIPVGILSDVIGRKKVLYLGLSLFLAGSILASLTSDIDILIIARVLQGSGAVSAVCLAYVADSVRGEQHGKVMAIIGASIGLSFVFAFILGSFISSKFGLKGLFVATSIFASLSLLFAFLLPEAKQQISKFKLSEFKAVLKDFQLFYANIQISILHLTLSASFFLIPKVLEKVFKSEINYLTFYLPAIIIAFIAVMPLIRKRELFKKIIPIKWFLLSLSLFLFASPLGFSSQLAFVVILTLFFFSFTYLEATLPTLLFAIKTTNNKGAVSGIYSVYQFTGNFLGGILGAQLYNNQLGGSIQSPFYTLAALAVLAFVITYFLIKKVNHHGK